MHSRIATELRLHLLGTWQARLDNRALPPLPTRHTRALLARLALAHPEPLPRSRLLDDLFSSARPGHAAGHLRITLHYLRRAMGKYLLTEESRVALDPSLRVIHDVGRFDALTVPGATVEMLMEAIALYRGPFLAQPMAGWAADEAHRLHRRYIAALRRVVTHARVLGKPELAREAAGRWAREEPWEEAAHVAFIAAHHALGERARAEAQIARARQLLRAEWDRPPGEEFEQLARAVARLPGDVPSEGPGPDVEGVPVELTIHDLEDLPLVGREEELARLWGLWVAAQRGAVQVCVIEGEAGIGKTRLANEFLARVRLRGRALILRGAVADRGTARAFDWLDEALAALSHAEGERVRAAGATLDSLTAAALIYYLPALARWFPEPQLSPLLLQGEAEAIRRRAALSALLEALSRAGPVLVLVEDVHHADEESLALVEGLAGETFPLLLLLTRRSGGSPLSWMTLPLAALNRAQMERLLVQALGKGVDRGWLERLLLLVGGNPLYAHETLRALAASDEEPWQPECGWRLAPGESWLPASLEEVLAGRLALLSPAALQLVACLAVLGRPAEPALLAQLWPDEEAHLAARAEAMERWVLVERENTLWFVHDWLAETLLAAIEARARAMWHERIARALAASPDSEPVERMRHHAGAGAWEAALEDALEAARRSERDFRLSLWDEALGLAEEAMGRLGYSPLEARRWPLLYARQRYFFRRYNPQAQGEFLLRMERLAEEHDNDSWRVAVLRGKADVEFLRDRSARREEYLNRAVTLARETGQLAEELRARTDLALVTHLRGAFEEAAKQSALAVDLSEQVSDPALRARALWARATVRIQQGEIEESEGFLETALSLAEQAQLWELVPQLLRRLGKLHFFSTRYDSALALFREGVHRAQALGDPVTLADATLSLLSALTHLGLYEEGRSLAESTLPLVRRLDNASMSRGYFFNLACILFYSGDLPAAREVVQESVAVAERAGHTPFIVANLTLAIAVARAGNQLSEALAYSQRAQRLFPNLEQAAAACAREAALTYLAAGQPERARAWAERAVTPSAMEGRLDPENLWEAANVLAATGAPGRASQLREEAYETYLTDIAAIADPGIRRAYAAATPAHRALASFESDGARRLLFLPLRGAPTGRPLHADELAPVVLTLHEPGEPSLDTPAGRRARLARLASEAVEQGTVATLDLLAQLLHASPRTLQRDIQRLRGEGVVVITRGSQG